MSFTGEVQERIGHYVYRLVDPSTEETFSVGKGVGNRVFTHLHADGQANLTQLANDNDPEGRTLDENEQLTLQDANDDLRLETIRELKRKGLEPNCVIHRHGLDEETADHVEAALIDAYPNLCNKVKGRGSNIYGPVTTDELQKIYCAEEVDFGGDRILMLNVNVSANGDLDVYEAVRLSWRINTKCADQADYVLAVQHGFIKGVFVAEEWLAATEQNFPNNDKIVAGRYGFRGAEAESDVVERYKGKRVPAQFTGSRSPIRYNYT